jgi:hypothetical protein
MKKLFQKILIGLFFPVLAFSASSITPLSVGIAPPVQFPSQNFTITGLRLSALWGHHKDLYGLDFGLIGNITDQDFAGLAVSGLFNKTTGNTTVLGLQLAGLGNMNTKKTSIIGLQAALGANINSGDTDLIGVQLAMANLSTYTDIFGLQLGLYNRAKEVYGFQIGIVNIADNLHGIQIGLINFNNKGLIGVCPILNIGF